MDERICGRILVTAVAFAAVIALAGAVPSAVAQQQSPTPITLSPAQPAAGDTIRVEADLVFTPDANAETPQVIGQQIMLPIGAPVVSPQPPSGTLQHFEWTLPALAVGNYTIQAPSATLGFTVRPRATQLALVSERFQVAVTDQQSGASPAAVLLSDAGGYYSFFDPTNIELTVKLVDGRPVNGQWWVFIASMTNTAFTVTVTDTLNKDCLRTANCPTRTYTNPPDTNQNFIDVAAFF